MSLSNEVDYETKLLRYGLLALLLLLAFFSSCAEQSIRSAEQFLRCTEMNKHRSAVEVRLLCYQSRTHL